MNYGYISILCLLWSVGLLEAPDIRYLFKETVDVTFKQGNARFTTIPLKPSSEQNDEDILVFLSENW